MAVAQTKAARIMQERSSELTSHQVISLLMAGALERVGQARRAALAGELDDKNLLFAKIVAIINGLRASLNMDQGGEIAENLDALYSYMVERLEFVSVEEEVVALDEVSKLIAEIKAGWDGMDLDVQELRAAAG